MTRRSSGSYDPVPAPTAYLRGLIVSDTLDARGSLDIHGTVISGFRPVEGQGPLYYGGRADEFFTSIGYFEPMYGNEDLGFGAIRLWHDPNVKLPRGSP